MTYLLIEKVYKLVYCLGDIFFLVVRRPWKNCGKAIDFMRRIFKI